jgi:hypothetical protein
MAASGFGDLGVVSPLVTNITLANLQNIASQFAINPSATTGLTIGITGGSAFISPATTATPVNAISFTLPINAVSYISLTAVGVVVAETPAMTIGNFPLWTFTTNGINIVSATDLRTIASPFVPVLGSTGGGGGGSVTNAAIATIIHASATNPALPADLDELNILDSAAAFVLKKMTWLGLKTALVSYLSALTSTWGLSISGNATTASTAGTVSTTIASGCNATTQLSSDNSTKVATTAFTQAVVGALSGAGKLIKFTVVSASGTFTKQAGTTQIIAFVVGGGGGGGGNVAGNTTGMYGGSGGGGGIMYTAAPAATYAVVVGAGGAAGNTAGTDGAVGGASSINGITASGGGGGAGTTISLGMLASATSLTAGGSTAFGSGGAKSAVAAAGVAGGLYGGGGSGAGASSVVGLAGGAGAAGGVFIWEY